MALHGTGRDRIVDVRAVARVRLPEQLYVLRPIR